MRKAVRSFVELFGLAGLAVAQPLLSIFGGAPDAFIIHDATMPDIVIFALAVTLVVPVVLWVVELLVGLISERAARVLHIALIGLLVAATAVPLLKKVGLPLGPAVVVVALAVAAGVVVLYVRFAATKTFLAFAALGPVLFLLLFLVASPTADLIGAGPVEAADVEAAREPRSIIIVVWDEWPTNSLVNGSGEIDAELYPNIASLADDGVWYRNATTVASATAYAVPAMLTGRYPPDQQTLAVANEYPENLFTLLASQYDLEVDESVTRLCPKNLCSGDFVDEPPPIEESAPPPPEPQGALSPLMSDAWESFKLTLSPTREHAILSQDEATIEAQPVEPVETEKAVREASEEQAEVGAGPGGATEFPILDLESMDSFLGSIEEDEPPTVHFLHVQLPHTPYKYFPEGQRYSAIAGLDPAMAAAVIGSVSEDPVRVAYERERLAMQVGYVDTLIGDITDRLEQTGLYDDSIVIMTSDHGAGFVPGGSIRAVAPDHGLPPELYADLLYVPLIIKAPGLEAGTTTDDNVMTTDIVPTIADLIGIELPWTVDGIALRTERRDDPTKSFARVRIGPEGPLGPMFIDDLTTFDGVEHLDAMLDRHVDTYLRDDNAEHRLYDVADGGELVGAQVEDLEVTGESSATAIIADLETHTSIAEDQDWVPAHFIGELDGVGPDRITVAIAVNGTIGAVVQTLITNGAPGGLDALAMPTLFRSGDNEIELFEVTGPSGRRELASIAIS